MRIWIVYIHNESSIRQVRFELHSGARRETNLAEFIKKRIIIDDAKNLLYFNK